MQNLPKVDGESFVSTIVFWRVIVLSATIVTVITYGKPSSIWRVEVVFDNNALT